MALARAGGHQPWHENMWQQPASWRQREKPATPQRQPGNRRDINMVCQCVNEEKEKSISVMVNNGRGMASSYSLAEKRQPAGCVYYD